MQRGGYAECFAGTHSSYAKGFFLSEQLLYGSETILLVDDDELVLSFLTAGLKMLGYDVRPFNESTAALVAFEQSPNDFDLVFTDIDMPFVDGFDLARVIKAQRADLPIVMCTGKYLMADTDEMVRLGIHTCLKKPFGHRDMAKVVRDELDRNSGEERSSSSDEQNIR